MSLFDLRPRRECQLSDDRLYRYWLMEQWDTRKPMQVFIGLNPSTADEEKDDPTVRRWKGFARDWGMGGIVICNAFAYRSTDWTALNRVDDPVGPENDHHIRRAVALAYGEGTQVVACWGGNASKVGDGKRGEHISQVARFNCFRRNGDGSPVHPLYLPKNLKPIPWNYEVRAVVS